jgi:hypothetical protein
MLGTLPAEVVAWSLGEGSLSHGAMAERALEG